MDKFEEILIKHQNNRFLVIDPIGGKGDKLIQKGMEKKLKELRIRFTTLEYKCEQTRLFEIGNSSILSHLPRLFQKKTQNTVYSLSKKNDYGKNV